MKEDRPLLVVASLGASESFREQFLRQERFGELSVDLTEKIQRGWWVFAKRRQTVCSP